MPVAKPLVLLPSLLVVYCKRSEKNDYFVAGSDRRAVLVLEVPTATQGVWEGSSGVRVSTL